MKNLFHYTIKTDKSVDEAVAVVGLDLKEEKFGVLWKIDLPVKLQE